MSEFKGTPGPWAWRWKSGSLHTLHDRGDYAFGSTVLSPTWEYDSGADTNVSDADANLIAAAPNLLAACEALMRRMVAIRKHHPNAWDGVSEMVCVEAHAAIKLAKEGNSGG